MATAVKADLLLNDAKNLEVSSGQVMCLATLRILEKLSQQSLDVLPVLRLWQALMCQPPRMQAACLLAYAVAISLWAYTEFHLHSRRWDLLRCV